MMTNDDVRQLLRQLYLQNRAKVISSLLSGNDAGCFTTQQYLDAWVKIVDKGRRGIIYPALVRRQLSSSPSVREVSPDVWAASSQRF